MYPETPQRAHYPALDILRGIAILAVVFFHNFHFIGFFSFGWMGVDLFFVLSGFLITNLLLTTLQSKHYFRNFFVRRVLRIFPLYYLVLFVFFTLSPKMFGQQGPESTYAYYNQNELWFWSYFQNWLMIQKGPAPVPYLTHFWSLGVEEQFYIFWPFVLFCFRRLAVLKKVIVTLIVFAVGFRLRTLFLDWNDVSVVYVSTFTRMDSLLVGCVLAVHLAQGKKVSSKAITATAVAFGALIAASLLVYGNLHRENFLFATIGYTVSAAFFSSLLYLLIQHEEIMRTSLQRLSALRFVGKISYGIYVYHVPIYLLLAMKFSQFISPLVSNSSDMELMISVLSLILTVLVSTASFYFIERPILGLKKHFP